ncbi:MAG: dihydroxy-acid dehydratase family protein [Bryobacteraceae bacterium]|nr:dihydroxy-acid dehydratase family protein [Bryobacteraceae bacterium]
MSKEMNGNGKRLRSEIWFNDMTEPGETAVYLERYNNYGITRKELQSGRPIIGIAQTGSDLTPCNRIHVSLASRVKDGIREAGGFPFEFPVHPLQESCRRPTAALDRNLAYLGLVEILCGYPLDGVVLMTGCDKTTPALLMAAATVNLPAIVLSGGPMIDSYFKGKLAGSGMALWEARRMLAAGEIDGEELIDMVCASAPSAGHCNTMGTALSMNSLAEALGMSLPGCAAIPAPYGERAKMAFETGKRIVEMVREDLTPDKILTRKAFENAIVVNSAIGGSTNCPPHLIAIARHIGVPLTVQDWETVGHDIPLLANIQPAGQYLGEGFHRAGGVPAIIGELMQAGKIHTDALTVTGKTVGENYCNARSLDTNIIRPYCQPLKEKAGFLVVTGNLFDSALVKTSVISEDFRRRFLSTPGSEDCFISRVVVFNGPEDYRRRINDPSLEIDETSMLVIRGAGAVAYPGSAEVVNMTPPDYLVKKGTRMLPCMGDGRQSGTSDSPSILNASPEAAAGGNLAILRTGDRVKVDLRNRRVDVLLSDEEIAERRRQLAQQEIQHDSPWQELYRAHVGQLESGACLEFAVKYRNLKSIVPRHSH